MKIILQRGDLKESLAGLGKIIPKTTTLPILGGVRFNAGKAMTLEATDLDQVAVYGCKNAVVEGPGSFVAGFQQLKELAKGNDTDKVEFATSGKDKVTVVNPIAGQNVRLEIPAMDPSEWPDSGINVKTQPVDGFLDVFQKLVPFASVDSNRLILNSCFLDVSDKAKGKSAIISTDGRRLTVFNSQTLPLKESCAVPTTRFLSWIKEGTSQIGTGKQGNVQWFSLETGPWIYTVKAVGGTYPNYRQVIPSEIGSNKITFADDIAPIRQILRTLPDEDKRGTVTLRAGNKGALVACAKGADEKYVSIELSGSIIGKCKQCAVSRHYLMDALNAGFRNFSFVDELSPLVSESNGAKHVLMPMRVEDAPIVHNQVPAAEPVKVTAQAEKPKEQEIKKEKKIMTKNSDTAIEKLLTAYETAREKVKELNTVLGDLASLIKDAVKEDKQHRSEIEDVRRTVAKIQAIKV